MKWLATLPTLAAMLAVPCLAQQAPADKSAIVVRKAEIQAAMLSMTARGTNDEPVRVVNIGSENLSLFAAHVDAAGAPQQRIVLSSHDDVSEVYLVLKGEGVLYHGGSFDDPKPRFSAGTSGAGKSGTTSRMVTQRIAAGDVFIVAPDTPHMILLGPRTEMEYLIVRVDPKKIHKPQ